MPVKTLIFCVCLYLIAPVFANDANHHGFPEQTASQDTPKSKLKFPGYCEIEIINQSYNDIQVAGTFDDGTPMWPFTVYSFEAPHYISLYYYGYCHLGMEIDIDERYSGRHLFGGYVRRGNSIRVVSSYNHAVTKAEIAPMVKH